MSQQSGEKAGNQVDGKAASPDNAAGSPASGLQTLAQTFKAVAWSFFGVRRRADYEQDVQKLNPVHVIVAGVLSAALFVGAVVMLVRWVVSSGVAA